MGKTLAVATVLVALLCCSPGYAGFTNNSGNATSVTDLGTSSGTFRINSLTDSGQMKTTANSSINPAVADSYSEEISESFQAYWVRTSNYSCGIDFDIVFDTPIIGIVATNAFRLNCIGPLGVDLMAAFTSATGIPSFGGNSNLALEILPFNPQNPDTLTVAGNRVFGSVHSRPENFLVLTGLPGSGSGVVGVPEPATMTVWGLLGLASSGPATADFDGNPLDRMIECIVMHACAHNPLVHDPAWAETPGGVFSSHPTTQVACRMRESWQSRKVVLAFN